MDRKIEKKSWPAKRVLFYTGIIAIAALAVYLLLFTNSSALNIGKERVIISEVKEDNFQEFLQVSGTVQPIVTNYLDAIEGGVVQQVFRESGAIVEQGDTILTMANSDLQLQVMQQTSGLYDQINNVRNSRLNLEQNTLQLQEQLANANAQMEILAARFDRQKRLMDQNLLAQQEFETTRENYEYQKKRYELTYESFKKDSVQAIRQMRQLDNSEARMYENLEAVQQILENLTVTAPIAGQLSTIQLHQGQLINSGERIGQIDVLDSYKIRVAIDEYHLARVSPGLKGSFDYGGQHHELEITKIYPVISEGQFEVDMEFIDEIPSGLRRGQTVRIRLELGASAQALQIPRGAFYQTTGGNWIFVVNEETNRAYRRDISLGRQNPDYFEVQHGLQAGEKVITSSYNAFGENEVLLLD